MLFQGAGSKVQVLYVNLKDGRQLVYLGCPMNETECDQIASFVVGETIDPAFFCAISSVLEPSLTAH